MPQTVFKHLNDTISGDLVVYDGFSLADVYREYKREQDALTYSSREYWWLGPGRASRVGYREISKYFARLAELEEAEVAAAEGQAFVRSEQRPQVGEEFLAQVMEPIRLLENRIQKLEEAGAKKGAKKGAKSVEVPVA